MRCAIHSLAGHTKRIHMAIHLCFLGARCASRVTFRCDRSPEQKSRFQPSCLMKSGMQKTSGVDLRISLFEKMTVFFKNAAWFNLSNQSARPGPRFIRVPAPGPGAPAAAPRARAAAPGTQLKTDGRGWNMNAFNRHAQHNIYRLRGSRDDLMDRGS
jgi:hypothetical protein